MASIPDIQGADEARVTGRSSDFPGECVDTQCAEMAIQPTIKKPTGELLNRRAMAHMMCAPGKGRIIPASLLTRQGRMRWFGTAGKPGYASRPVGMASAHAR